MRVAINKQREQARELLTSLQPQLDATLVEAILNANESDEAGIHEQRERIDRLRDMLKDLPGDDASSLLQLSENLARKSVWIVGGDGWAYDIGFGGLDHVLASGEDVNILVLDTEVYSNTGGQTSKATPRGAVAKFSAAGKTTPKKDLAMLAMDYEQVYVAQIAYGAKDTQTLRTFLESESYHGPSLIIAYAPCAAHGIDMINNHQHQQMAVDSGHWQLFRYDPRRIGSGQNPLRLDSKAPSIDYKDFLQTEARFSTLWDSHPEEAEAYLQQAKRDIHHRFRFYQQLADMDLEEQAGEETTG